MIICCEYFFHAEQYWAKAEILLGNAALARGLYVWTRSGLLCKGLSFIKDVLTFSKYLPFTPLRPRISFKMNRAPEVREKVHFYHIWQF